MADGPDLPAGVAASIAHATAALTQSDDLAGTLYQLLADATSAAGVTAAGLLALLSDGSVEVLSSTSHRALELELYQSQVEEGPCLESIRTRTPVAVVGAAELRRRWPKFAEAARAAGYSSVFAFPLFWQDAVIGGLNLFRQAETPLSDEQVLLSRAFADMATIAIVHTGRVRADEAGARAVAALSSRTVVEQAKGVLGYTEGISMAAAYERLLQLSASSGESLGRTAADVVHRSQQR